MLPELLNLLTLCIMHVSETLSRTGFAALSELVNKTGSQFDEKTWDSIVKAHQDLFQRNTPFRISSVSSNDDVTPTSRTSFDAGTGEIDKRVSPSVRSIVVPDTESEQTQANGHAEHATKNTVAITVNHVDDDSNQYSDDGDGDDDENDPHLEEADRGVGVNQNGDLEGEFDRVRSKCLVQVRSSPRFFSGSTVGNTGSNLKLFIYIYSFIYLTFQLELVKCVGDLSLQYHTILPPQQHTALLHLLHTSYSYASTFNKDIKFRIALQRAGLLKNLPNQLPSLLKQEVVALSTYIRVCHAIFLHTPRSQLTEMVEGRLMEISLHVLASYIAKESHVTSIPTTDRDIVRAEQHRELIAWNEIVIDIIRIFSTLNVQDSAKHLPQFLESFLSLTVCDSRDVREALRDLLLKQCHSGRLVVADSKMC
jgi:hypothetical protein